MARNDNSLVIVTIGHARCATHGRFDTPQAYIVATSGAVVPVFSRRFSAFITGMIKITFFPFIALVTVPYSFQSGMNLCKLFGDDMVATKVYFRTGSFPQL